MTTPLRATRHRFAVAIAMALLASSCSSGNDASETQDPSEESTTGSQPGPSTKPIVMPVGLHLSEGQAQIGDFEAIDLVDGIALSDAEVAAILARLPDWKVPADDRLDFNRPVGSLRPPLTGNTIESEFPPPVGADNEFESPTGPLHVLRYQPQGEVDIAPFLSITFDHAMVPLAPLDQLDDQDVPVMLTPSIDGRWRWIGTRTLRFEVLPGDIDRLPAATEYTIEVAAGTKSLDGSELAKTVSWNFATPRPLVETFVGASTDMALTPVFVAVFNQRIDAASVLEHINLRAGGQLRDVRLATAAEIQADENARYTIEDALDSRSVAFRATDPLPADSGIAIEFTNGIPSAEGPLESAKSQPFTGHTFSALKVLKHSCNYEANCVPLASLFVEFNNTLDTTTFEQSMVTVEPAILGMRTNVWGATLEIVGATQGRTTYTVTISSDIRDQHLQSLGEDIDLEFDIGSAPPSLQAFDRQFITTDPGADTPTVSIATINHDAVQVQAWKVGPADLDPFFRYIESMRNDNVPVAWEKVFDERVAIEGDADALTETAIDLSDAFNHSDGQLVVRIAPVESFSPNETYWWANQPTVAWVQHTTLGVDAILDSDELLVWTTDLSTGKPVGGVDVELVGDGRTITTNSDGLVRIDLSGRKITGLFATIADQSALLSSGWYDGWQKQPQSAESRWFVFDDRGVYRPGETARVTGWVRKYSRADSALSRFGAGAKLAFTAFDPAGVEIASGLTDLNALGGFNFSIDIPEGANLGEAWVDIHVVGSASLGTSHLIQIDEYRTPEFEVTTRTESSGPYFNAQPATVAVDAEYFAGGPLADAPVDWLVTVSNTTYSPPNWDSYTFGVWVPWWSYGRGYGAEGDFAPFGASESFCYDCGPSTPVTYEEYHGVTNSSGTHYLQVDFSAPSADLPSTITAESTVTDVNRQGWSSRTDLLVHSARFYVGLQSDRTFVREGTPLSVDAVVTDVDGALAAGRSLTVTAGRLEWQMNNGEWGEVVVDTETCNLTSTTNSTDESMRCDFTADVGGTYRITAIVTDDDGHNNRTELTQWVTGGAGAPARNVEQETVTIVPDRQVYAPGDTAELLVQAPFSPATGLITMMHNGIVSAETFEAVDGSAVLQIPIRDAQVPGVSVQIDMVGNAGRLDDDGNPVTDAPDRPAFATGVIDLSIPPITRGLTVTATPADVAVEPGDNTSVNVSVAGPDGRPVVGADVAIVIVDEAVLAMTGYQLGDPLDAFYPAIWSDVYSTYMRSTIMLANSKSLSLGSGERAEAGTDDLANLEEGAFAPTFDSDNASGAAEKDGTAIALRNNFDALALYAPGERTGADGSVTVNFKLPDSLTRYRVMAVAVSGTDHFGKGEATITARLPLMIRPSAPRFLNFGDHFELAVVVQNQTDSPMVVDVAIETANLSLTATAGKRVTVPANDRVEVRLPAAANDAGIARFRVVAISGTFADAAEIALPVYTPATAEAFATYGVIDSGAIAQPVLAPVDVYPQFGGLEINTSSTALQALTDAVLYLVDYRYESASGLASRIMAIAALRDVLDAFDADGLPDEAALNAQVANDIAALVALQNDDGGFDYWQRGQESVPWETIQAAHALVVADQAGYEVPESARDRVVQFLASIESHIPTEYDRQIKVTLGAYALYVRNLSGDRDVAKANSIFFDIEPTQLDAFAWVWPVLRDGDKKAEIARIFANRAVETAVAATFATDYGEGAYLISHSDHRMDGIILDALITQTPESDLIPKVVAGLLGNQERGRWNNVHENAFILLAMKRYFDTFESVTPDFVARAWLGDLFVAEHEFAGRTTDRASTLVPMSQLIVTGDSQLVLSKAGAGRLYYRLGLRYAPTDLDLAPRDEGFVVERTYEAVDDPADVIRDSAGVWHIKAGATVKVVLTMVADARRTHVALIDPLPAGLEPINPALANSRTIPDEDTHELPRFWCDCWQWFEHQNLRDDRAEAYTSLLFGGTYEYSYYARATTLGTFVVPPTRAEEIYSPEVFGRSASGVVVVG